MYADGLANYGIDDRLEISGETCSLCLLGIGMLAIIVGCLLIIFVD